MYLRLTPEESEPEPEHEPGAEKETPKEEAPKDEKKEEAAKETANKNQKNKGKKGGNKNNKNGPTIPVLEELEFDIGPKKSEEVEKEKATIVKEVACEEKLNEDGVPYWFIQLEKDVAELKNPTPKRKPRAKSMSKIVDLANQA